MFQSFISLALLIVCLLLVGPIFTILSLNTLFGLTIPINIWTWLSAFWLGALVYGSTVTTKSN